MEFDELKTAVAFAGVIAIGVAVLLFTPMGEQMGTDTVLTMVAPSMLVFGAVCLGIGVLYGQHRASPAN